MPARKRSHRIDVIEKRRAEVHAATEAERERSHAWERAVELAGTRHREQARTRYGGRIAVIARHSPVGGSEDKAREVVAQLHATGFNFGDHTLIRPLVSGRYANKPWVNRGSQMPDFTKAAKEIKSAIEALPTGDSPQPVTLYRGKVFQPSDPESTVLTNGIVYSGALETLELLEARRSAALPSCLFIASGVELKGLPLEQTGAPSDDMYGAVYTPSAHDPAYWQVTVAGDPAL